MTRILNVKDGDRPSLDCVYIGRFHRERGLLLPASKWRNPYRIGVDGTRDEVIEKYRAYLLATPRLVAALPELRGKDLLCWCAPERCHGEVLLALANVWTTWGHGKARRPSQYAWKPAPRGRRWPNGLPQRCGKRA